MKPIPQAQYKPDIKPVNQGRTIPLLDAKILLQILTDSIQQAWDKTVEDVKNP